MIFSIFENDEEDKSFRKKLKKLIDIIFYRTINNNCPVAEFLLNLPNRKLLVKTIDDMTTLAQLKYMAKFPLSKPIEGEDNLFELRSQFGSDGTRIFYFFIFGDKIVMTNGFLKKSQRTPQREIELAKKYKKDYIERNGG